MRHHSIPAFLSAAPDALAKGPIAIIMAEDGVELSSTLRHHLAQGFAKIILLTLPDIAPDAPLPAAETDKLIWIDYDVYGEDALSSAVNQIQSACPENTWIYYGYSAEYLFYPFAETRSIRDLLNFHSEERRSAMLCYVVDLYAKDLAAHPNGVSREQAHFDRIGYYALPRKDPAQNWAARERQMDFYGGLRWRFEEHIPWSKRKIDRIALFRSAKDLILRPDFTFDQAEYNTYACPWHNNLTAAICSFRTAKALRANPGSRQAIASFAWPNAEAFSWRSQQLMDAGLMEPGQWF